MRSTYRVALAALAAALALGALSASAALAAPEWYSSPTTTKFEWQQGKAALGAAIATKSKGTLTVTDAGAGVTVECKDLGGEGAAGPGAVDSQTTFAATNCKAIGCANSEEVKEVPAIHLPWSAELVYSGKYLDDLIKPATGGLGFKFTCKMAGVKVTDVCETTSFSPTTTNVAEGTEVSAFTEGMHCSIGGAKVGKVAYDQVIEAVAGAKLEANAVSGTFSKLSGSLNVSATGTLGINDKEKEIGAECAFSTSGTIGTPGKGTITEFGAHSCVGLGQCASISEVTAINIPWNTELYESTGLLFERAASGGRGTPGWHFSCKTKSGTTQEDTCNLNTGANAENALNGNVEALFEYTPRVTCSKDSFAEQGVWSGGLTIKPSSVGAIEVKK